jgi:hypothetical protein
MDDMPETQRIDKDGSPKYTAPTISDYGDLVDLTAGLSSGTQLDATFSAGTPFNQLTFSTPAPGH